MKEQEVTQITEKLNNFFNDKMICIAVQEERGIVTDFIKPLIAEQRKLAQLEVIDTLEQCYSMDMGDYIEISHKKLEAIRKELL